MVLLPKTPCYIRKLVQWFSRSVPDGTWLFDLVSCPILLVCFTCLLCPPLRCSRISSAFFHQWFSSFLVASIVLNQSVSQWFPHFVLSSCWVRAEFMLCSNTRIRDYVGILNRRGMLYITIGKRHHSVRMTMIKKWCNWYKNGVRKPNAMTRPIIHQSNPWWGLDHLFTIAFFCLFDIDTPLESFYYIG